MVKLKNITQKKEYPMTYVYFLKQQVADFFLVVFVTSLACAIATYYGFRNPIELTPEFYSALIGAAFAYILLGSTLRYFAFKKGA